MTEDSQQISVAELLKRNGQSVESRGGRRRRGVAGGISVAELTGEIPIVRQSGSRAAAEPESDEPAAQPEAAAPENSAPSAPAEAVAETAKSVEPAPKVPADRTAALAALTSRPALAVPLLRDINESEQGRGIDKGHHDFSSPRYLS